MTCRLFGAKPLSKPVLGYCELNHWEQTLVSFFIKIQNVSFTKMHMKISSAKWQPFCPGRNGLIGAMNIIAPLTNITHDLIKRSMSYHPLFPLTVLQPILIPKVCWLQHDWVGFWASCYSSNNFNLVQTAVTFVELIAHPDFDTPICA